jgi:DNA-binding transcriptional LysR family regulator
MIVRGQTSGTKKEFDHYLEKNGMADRKLHIVAHMNQADAVKSSVVSGLGVAVVSQMAAKKYESSGDLLVFDLDAEGAYRDIYLVYPKELVFSKAERDFVSFADQPSQRKIINRTLFDGQRAAETMFPQPSTVFAIYALWNLPVP